jgi:hypothetical protein
MMNVARFFAAVIAVWVVVENTLIAQGNEPSAEVEVRNVVVLPPRHVEFDLVLTNRYSSVQTAWRTWANGTFFLTTTNLSLAGATLNVDSSGLPPERSLLGSRRLGYEMLTLVQAPRQRIGIVIMGADSVENTVLVLPDSSRILGRFRLSLADTIREPERVRFAWVQPTSRFQANAFKTAQEQTVEGKRYNSNDNIEMPTRYRVDAPTVELAPTLRATRLQAEYAGDKRVRVRWATTEERVGRRTNAGFLLLRQLVGAAASSTVANNFDTVASFSRTLGLRLRGASGGAEYEFLDSVPTRGDVYAYRLGFLDATVRPAQEFRAVFSTDTAQAAIPNAVLASAAASPNPFGENTLVSYTLLDRARVTAWLYDATGRIVREIFANVERPRGEYSFTLDGSSLPNQAAYFLLLSALPVNDAAVERSQTTLKIQLSR